MRDPAPRCVQAPAVEDPVKMRPMLPALRRHHGPGRPGPGPGPEVADAPGAGVGASSQPAGTAVTYVSRRSSAASRGRAPASRTTQPRGRDVTAGAGIGDVSLPLSFRSGRGVGPSSTFPDVWTRAAGCTAMLPARWGNVETGRGMYALPMRFTQARASILEPLVRIHPSKTLFLRSTRVT